MSPNKDSATNNFIDINKLGNDDPIEEIVNDFTRKNTLPKVSLSEFNESEYIIEENKENIIKNKEYQRSQEDKDTYPNIENLNENSKETNPETPEFNFSY